LGREEGKGKEDEKENLILWMVGVWGKGKEETKVGVHN